jgi:outer membrane protein
MDSLRTTKFKVRKQPSKEKEDELQDTELATLMGVVKGEADAESSLRNLRASEDLLRAARASFDSSQRRYTHGVADIVEVLSTQTALADARAQRERCLAEWRSARLQLLASAGVLNRMSVQN